MAKTRKSAKPVSPAAGAAKGKRPKTAVPAAKPKSKPKKPRVAAVTGIMAWEDDPLTTTGTRPVSAAIPTLAAPRLALTIIVSNAPPPGNYTPGTAEFRYWAAAEALARARDFWSPILPSGTNWHPGGALEVRLDEGQDLNAYYDRAGLSFFHEIVKGQTVFSGESPDVVCHELGHAILDSIRPQLWDAGYDEVGAFHESFGDMSALLSALQLESLRNDVLLETGGRLYRSSRLSRLAEQLGWAIRQARPDLAEVDCLRNAVNTLFYRDPLTLPPSGPVAVLSSEPHSFSRVFTGAFFEALAGMLATVQSVSGPTSADLLDVSEEIGKLLIASILSASIVPDYYSQIAAGMIAAGEQAPYLGKHRDALKSAFVRHGILSLEAAAMVGSTPAPKKAGVGMGMMAGAAAAAAPLQVPGKKFGLGERTLLIHAPEEPRWSMAAASSLSVGSLPAPSRNDAAEAYVSDLFRRGRVDFGDVGDKNYRICQPHCRKTHQLTRVETANGEEHLMLKRQRFDCGFGNLALGFS